MIQSLRAFDLMAFIAFEVAEESLFVFPTSCSPITQFFIQREPEKKKIKLAGEEIDKVLEIWILLIPVLALNDKGEKSDLRAKSIVLYLGFSDNGKPS